MRNCRSTPHCSRPSGHALPIQKTKQRPPPTQHSTCAFFLHLWLGDRNNHPCLFRTHCPTLRRAGGQDANPQARVKFTVSMRNTHGTGAGGAARFQILKTVSKVSIFLHTLGLATIHSVTPS